jgi:hypothetical protein
MSLLWDPKIKDDPLAFVMTVFPWGQPNTPLANFKGPRKWQVDVLNDIKKYLKSKDNDVYKLAVSSGRGIGKSALVAWLVYWMISTRLGSSSIVTANTEGQLKSRTWAELGKWHAMALNEHWFEKQALSLKPHAWFEKELKEQLKIDTGYYYAQAQLWSEENPDAFAGVHNMSGVLLIMDESSGIPTPIWKVSEGFFTEPVKDRYWFTFSNPRNNTGAFYECFHKNRDFWKTREIDSRTVEGMDLGVLEGIINQYGEDSDEARVEVKGQFPRTGDDQYIGAALVREAMTREVILESLSPLIMGVDVARKGDDNSVIAFRRGRDARSIPWLSYKRIDMVRLAGFIMEAAVKYNPDAIFIDGGGPGGGVVDILKAHRFKVIEVDFGKSAQDEERFRRKREEMWARMKDWLSIGCLPDENRLRDDLTTPQYTYTIKNQLALESKKDIRSRGGASPDYADALAMTFAGPVANKSLNILQGRSRTRLAKGVDYKVI